METTIANLIDAALQAAAGDPLMVAFVLAAATFLTEDGALISGSLLVGSGIAGAGPVIAALVLGIFLGDILLYAFGRGARDLRFFTKYLPLRRVLSIKHWLQGRESAVLFLSRFTPGTRFITYVGFGFLRLSLIRFASVLFIAAVLWVTALVLFISEIQSAASILGPWGAALVAGVVALTLLFILPRLFRRTRFVPPTTP